MNTEEICKQVSEQYNKFDSERDSVLKKYSPEFGDSFFVVYLDGVKFCSKTQEEALEWACKNLGYYAGFTVAPSIKEKPIRIRWF